jgi:hypothetical protein
MKIHDSLHGAYTHRLARQTLGHRTLRRAVDSGALVGFGRGVLLDAGRVLDLRTRCAGALLLAGPTAVIVGPTAAALHGCTAVGGHAVHVRLSYADRVRSRYGLVVHQGPVEPADVVVVDGLPVLALDLAVADVLCSAPRRAALACADQALHGLPPAEHAEFVARVRCRLAERTDRRGTRRAAELLALATGVSCAPIESALRLVIADAGLPTPVCGYETGRTRLPLAWPAHGTALVVDDAVDLPGWQLIHAGPADLTDPTALTSRLRTLLTERAVAA